MDIKLNDVYKFRFKKEYAESLHNPYHCFDDKLIVRADENGELYLQDTYWGLASFL